MIYTVTVFFIYEEKIKRERQWGYFLALADAEKCIEENWGDIYECGYYNYAVIEELPEGICPKAKLEKWYKAEYKKDWWKPGYEKDSYSITKTNKPEFLEKVIGFSMG
jgi:hypothetical protein